MITESRIIWVCGQMSGIGGGVAIAVGDAKPVGLELGNPVEFVVDVGVAVTVDVGKIVGLTVAVGVWVGLRVGCGKTVRVDVVVLIWRKSMFDAVIVCEPGVWSIMLKVPTPFTRFAVVGNFA
jgi:hypothetical protein